MSEIKSIDFFMFIFLSLPYIGGIYTIITKVFLRGKLNFKLNIYIYTGSIVVLIFCLLMLCYIILFCFFRHIPLPVYITILGSFFLLISWFAINGLLLGLGKVVSAGYGSATSILSDIDKTVDDELVSGLKEDDK